MKKLLYMAIAVAIAATSLSSQAIDGLIAEKEYPTTLNAGKALVYARLDGENLRLAIDAPASGWVSIGLGSERMNGSRLFMAYVKDGVAFYSEELATGVSHRKASDASALQSAARESGGRTVFEFSVKAAHFLKGGVVDLIWGYSEADDFRTKHRERGSIKLRF
jgi:hypothetical protein